MELKDILKELKLEREKLKEKFYRSQGAIDLCNKLIDDSKKIEENGNISS